MTNNIHQPFLDILNEDYDKEIIQPLLSKTEKFVLCHMRLNGNAKPYWENQLEEFATRFVGSLYGSHSQRTIIQVQFGKQDIRGGFSICLIDERHCIPKQKYFKSKDALLGFVEGWNMSENNNTNNFH